MGSTIGKSTIRISSTSPSFFSIPTGATDKSSVASGLLTADSAGQDILAAYTVPSGKTFYIAYANANIRDASVAGIELRISWNAAIYLTKYVKTEPGAELQFGQFPLSFAGDGAKQINVGMFNRCGAQKTLDGFARCWEV